MSPSEFLTSFLKGVPDRNLRLISARGLAPLPPNEMLVLLVHLSGDPDKDVAAEAERTLGSWPEEDLLSQVQSNECNASIMQYLADTSRSTRILEGIVLNPLAPASVVERLALRATGSLLETILYNRIRLLEHPTILANIKQNPAITPEAARLVQEIEVDFFGSKKADYAVGSPAAREPDLASEAAAPSEPPCEDLSLEGLPIDPDEREAAMAERLSRMSVPQKVQHALLGTREARAILIRDPNKQVAHSVLKSPKLSDVEIEAFAAMRNVSDEILREIGNNRSWLRSYPVVQNLTRNPRTPPATSQRLIPRLMNRDLMNLARDRGVPEAVRRIAERTYHQRLAQHTAG